MRRHIVGTFGVVTITRRFPQCVFRSDAFEKIRQIQHYVGIGILLNHQRCRGVLDEQRQQTGFRIGRRYPGRHFVRARIQTFSARANFQDVVHLLYGYALGQVAWLIDITSASDGNVIRQHLQRDHFEYRQQ